MAPRLALTPGTRLGVYEITAPLGEGGIDCSVLNQLSFWDALILGAASAAGCGVVLSEDLNPGQLILGVKVENPFA